MNAAPRTTAASPPADDRPVLRKHELDIMAEAPMTAGSLTWYALRVAAQRELGARDGLAERGWNAYCPVRTRWVRKGRGRSVRDRVEREYALLPRYVLVGFDEPPPWYEVCAVDHVHGPLGNSGRPSIISAAEVQRIMDREARGEWRAKNRDKRMIDRFLRVGDIVPAKALRLPVYGERDLEVTGVRGVTAILSGLGLLGCEVISVDMRKIDREKLGAV